MNRNELEIHIDRILAHLDDTTDELRSMRDSSSYDEDYKVERDPTITHEFFQKLLELSRAVTQHTAQEGSPFP